MRKYPTLLDQRFGMLTVIAQAPSTKNGQRQWLCRCDCGTEKTVLGCNLKRGTTVSCGCKHKRNLAGQKIGKLTVLERSDRYGSRGKRKTPLWKCQCECGAITYKATDTLTNSDMSMCQECAGRYATKKAREKAGFEGGTQLTKIKNSSEKSNNGTGFRGVYYDGKTGRFRARLKFKGKLYNLGSYYTLDEAVKARRRGEEEIYGKYLEKIEQSSNQTDPNVM